jgi:uncharacterized protein
MIFEIDEIPEGGLNFDLLENKEQFKIDQPDCSLAENVKIKGRLKRVEHEIFFVGKLETHLQVNCTRCLKPFLLLVKNKVQVHFVPELKDAFLGSEVEIKETDVDKEAYQEDRIDIRGSVRDQILLDVPLIRLCQKDCKGICPACGNDFNLEQCKCRNDVEIDPRFAVLKNFKDKLK